MKPTDSMNYLAVTILIEMCINSRAYNLPQLRFLPGSARTNLNNLATSEKKSVNTFYKRSYAA